MTLKLDSNQKQIRKRLLEIINNAHTSHIGSCISVIDIIDSVYAIKKKEEKFVLSNGHTAAALYVILEKYGYIKNPDLNELHIHPDRNPEIGIDVSSGSLGQGLPIAVGLALANKNKNVYCLISDGECAEGSIWESLRIVYDLNITNLKIILSVNGWGAYDPVNSSNLENRLKGFGFSLIKINGHDPKSLVNSLNEKYSKPTIIFAQTDSEQLPFLKGLDAHYYTMNESDYQLVQEVLK